MTNPDVHLSRTRAAAVVHAGAVFFRLGLTSFGGPVAHLGYNPQRSLLELWRVPPWAVVCLTAAAGQWPLVRS